MQDAGLQGLRRCVAANLCTLEFEGTRIFRNVGNHSPNPHARRDSAVSQAPYCSHLSFLQPKNNFAILSSTPHLVSIPDQLMSDLLQPNSTGACLCRSTSVFIYQYHFTNVAYSFTQFQNTMCYLRYCQRLL